VVETLVLGRGGADSQTGPMLVRCNRRVKDDKSHDYWSVVESRRLTDGRVVQRQVLYLGGINASQHKAWRKTIEVQDEDTQRQVALFPLGSLPADAVNASGGKAQRVASGAPAAVGRLLAVVHAVAATRPGPLLGAAPTAFARRYAVATGAANAGG